MDDRKFQMTDIHMHIIPGVDDGSWSMEMSFSMLFMAFCQGIRKIVATPHSSAFDEGRERVEEIFAELKRQTGERLPEMELYLGCEVLCRENGMDRILDMLERGIYPSLNDTRYVLAEFSTRAEAEEIFYCTGRLQSAGWLPVIAHAERYPALFGERDEAAELKKRGCRIQINAYSLLDEGQRIRENARKLVEKRLADFLGTDAHRMNHRPPCAERELSFLYSLVPSDYGDCLAFGNAEAYLLEGRK